MATGGPKPEIAKFGYVEFRSKHLKSYRKRWLVLYEGTWETPARLVKYTNEKEAIHDPKGRHQYYFNDVISAERLSGKKGVRVQLASKECTEICFTCDSEAGADDWVRCIQKQVTGKRDSFPVTVLGAAHANINGNVTIHIGDCQVSVLQDGKPDLVIPLTTIRKYQMDADSVFWIETGRSSPIGEGFLTFRSSFAFGILSRLDDEARQKPNAGESPPGEVVQHYSAHSTNGNYISGAPPALPKVTNRPRFNSDSPVPDSRQLARLEGMQRDVYPKIPTAHSLPRLPTGDNYSLSTGYRRQEIGNWPEYGDRGHRWSPESQSHEWGEDRGRRQEFNYLGGDRRVRRNSGSRLVAPDPNMHNRDPPPRNPYLPMANPVSRETARAICEEKTPYTDMYSPGSSQPLPKGTLEEADDHRDYLTPMHGRPDARFRSDNRYS